MIFYNYICSLFIILQGISFSAASNLFSHDLVEEDPSNHSTITATKHESEEIYEDFKVPILIEGDIAGEWSSIAAAYGEDVARSFGLKEEPHKKGPRGSAPQLPIWRQEWVPSIEKFNINVYISTRYTLEEKEKIKRALKDLQRVTGVIRFNFVPTPPTQQSLPYIHIISARGCWSFVGRTLQASRSGGQLLSLNVENCIDSRGIIQHEMLHALGFFHEQSRPDRDKYINVNWQNISEQKWQNFRMSKFIDTLETKYDYSSVMHYGERDFSINGQKTIDAKGSAVGQRNRVSWRDIQQIQLMYQCREGVRTLSEHQSPNKCTQSCRCARRQRGCGNDDNLCKGRHRCVNNRCRGWWER